VRPVARVARQVGEVACGQLLEQRARVGLASEPEVDRRQAAAPPGTSGMRSASRATADALSAQRSSSASAMLVCTVKTCSANDVGSVSAASHAPRAIRFSIANRPPSRAREARSVITTHW
jgi:hypothetical protein